MFDKIKEHNVYSTNEIENLRNTQIKDQIYAEHFRSVLRIPKRW